MEQKELVAQPEEARSVTVPEMVQQALASGRGREEMEIAERLLKLQIMWEANEAHKAFAQAKARLKFPPIPKNKTGADGRTSYADYADMQAIIEPIYQAEGFDLSFNSSEKPDEKGGITIYGILTHAQGHEPPPRSVWQPISSVSRMMNPNQAIMSATSYGKRALATMIFNLKLIGVDNDAASFSFINERQILTLQKLIEQCKMDPASVSKFLTVVGVKSVGDILARDFEAAFNLLLKKRAKVNETAAKAEKK